MWRKLSVLLVGSVLAGCVTTDGASERETKAGKVQVDDAKALEAAAKAHLESWQFLGEKPSFWRGTLSGRSFNLQAVGVSESRSVNWKIHTEGDRKIFTTARGDLTLTFTKGVCEVEGQQYPYTAVIETRQLTHKGCAIDLSSGAASDAMKTPGADLAIGSIDHSTPIDPVQKAKASAKAAAPTTIDATNMNWQFAGEGREAWSATIRGRQFQFSSMAASESRRMGWSVEGGNRLRASTGDVVIDLTKTRCSANGESYPYTVVLSMNGSRYQGCGKQ